MSFFKDFFGFFLLFVALHLNLASAVTFDIRNNCPYTVWAAAVPGGGRRLDRGQNWVLNVNPGTAGAPIWARTNCQFDGAGRGRCQTGDCGGLLQCRAYGVPPNTLTEFALNQYMNLDFIDILILMDLMFPWNSARCLEGAVTSSNVPWIS
ncbi:hypothetical protein Ddye_012924 [Dipteronia dyeriana]|uniref:Thaumatin-like protein n=1 Tax=Dipteronia dyeriana TaxID=168575 RepID=A0AAE0CJP8_9ROSI|nr:hypothetical protein Ddye_012924 [Dipteronia dyeriana]